MFNPIQFYEFGKSRGSVGTNTEIGGVSASLGTAAALASILAIDVNRISNFSVVGLDIKCRISGAYVLSNNFIDSPITYYYDNDNLISSITDSTFRRALKFINLRAYGVTTITGERAFQETNLDLLDFPNLTSTLNISFNEIGFNTFKKTQIYIPKCATLGTSASVNNSCFFGLMSGSTLYLKPSLETANSGAEEADVAYARTIGCVIRYVTNFTAPNAINNLSEGNIYNAAVQLNFTAPSGTNAIDYYECYANGVFKNKVTASGQYITGLTANIAYQITVIAVDVLYNKSVVSNTVSVLTSNYSYTDSDANAYILAASLTSSEQESAYKLIVDLKSNLLYTKIQALYPFKGTTAAQHKFNAKNPLDTDAAFRLIFGGSSNTHSDLGYSGNGSGYADSKFTPSINQTLNSNGITVSCGTNNEAKSSDVVEVGAFNSATQASLIGVKNNNTNFGKVSRLNGNPLNANLSNESRGILTVTRQSQTVTSVFFNSNKVATGDSGGTLPTFPIWIGCLNLTNSAYGSSNQRLQIVIIHEGLSDSEVATLHSIINLSELIAGRKTW
jgi:hypothetical protein